MIDATCPGCDRMVVIEQEGDNAICSRCNNLASDLLYGVLAHGTVREITAAVETVGRLGLIPAAPADGSEA